jgi:hypothetical protein
MKCDVCGKLPVSDEVIFSRGYLWHRPCCHLIVIGADELVDFPSDGKLIPETIITQEESKGEGRR